MAMTAGLTLFEKRKLVLPFSHGHMRPLAPEDVHIGYVDGLNDAEVNQYLVTVRERVQTTDSVRAFVGAQLLAPDAILFGIWRAGQTAHCGTLRLHGLDANRGCQIGICIFDKTAWKTGLGSAAISAATAWALDELRCSSVEAGAYLDNVGSWKTFLKSGYSIVEDIAGRYVRDGKPVVVRRMIASHPKPGGQRIHGELSRGCE